MALEALDHYTIQCADMIATRDFYCDVIGLTNGFRPKFGFAGYWLYCGDIPVVHLLDADGALHESRGAELGANSGRIDHVAFRGRDVGRMIARLKAHGLAFRENQIPDLGLR